MIEKICEQCTKAFEVYPYREKTPRFCSTLCQNNWQKGKQHHKETEFKKDRTLPPVNYKRVMIDYNGRKIFRFKGIVIKLMMILIIF